jgi:hypothetical protein
MKTPTRPDVVNLAPGGHNHCLFDAYRVRTTLGKLLGSKRDDAIGSPPTPFDYLSNINNGHHRDASPRALCR